MNRREMSLEVSSLKGDAVLLELPTGTGKSKMAIDRLRSLNGNKKGTLLIAVPRNVNKDEWQKELAKWWARCPLDITYTTYMSLPKHAGKWDYAVFDECHHLSERCREALGEFEIGNTVLCSATVGVMLKEELSLLFNGMKTYRKSMRDVVDDGVLPDPEVFLLPLPLDNANETETAVYNKYIRGPVTRCSWKGRKKLIRERKGPVYASCTPAQYMMYLDSQISWKKDVFMRYRLERDKNIWLMECGKRLKWLSEKKEPYLHSLLAGLEEYRTLVFCGSIAQTKRLGDSCINSQDGKAEETLRDFNEGRISHITACNMLNEGMNLMNCKVGIYANLNSSETVVAQRMGRLLRHKKPVVIIPYIENSREEELAGKMMQGYNPELVRTIEVKDIERIKELIN